MIKYNMFTTNPLALHLNVTPMFVDVMCGFHESTFTDFHQENGVRELVLQETDTNVYVSEVEQSEGLLKVIEAQIFNTESWLDDLDEDSEEFVQSSEELDTLVKFRAQLKG